MEKVLRFSLIWLFVLIAAFVPFIVASKGYQKWINVVEDELFAIYQDHMPLSLASSASIGAYTFKKDRVRLEVGDHFRLFFAEEASKNAERARKFMPFLGTTLLILLGIGIVALIVFFFGGAIKSVKSKRLDNRYLKPSVVLFTGITIVIGIFSYQSSVDDRRSFSMGIQLYEIGQYSTNIVYKFVELSNIFYEISAMEEVQFQEEGWLAKMVLAKKKNEALLNELETIEKWSVPKDSHSPRYEDTITPAMEMSKRLKKYFDLAATITSNVAEKKIARAESYAEFSQLLEKLSDALKGAVKYSGIYMKHVLEFNQFDKDAVAKFQQMENDPPDTKYNVKLLFGYTVYQEIKKKAAAEEAYEKRAALLKNE